MLGTFSLLPATLPTDSTTIRRTVLPTIYGLQIVIGLTCLATAWDRLMVLRRGNCRSPRNYCAFNVLYWLVHVFLCLRAALRCHRATVNAAACTALEEFWKQGGETFIKGGLWCAMDVVVAMFLDFEGFRSRCVPRMLMACVLMCFGSLCQNKRYKALVWHYCASCQGFLEIGTVETCMSSI